MMIPGIRQGASCRASPRRRASGAILWSVLLGAAVAGGRAAGSAGPCEDRAL